DSLICGGAHLPVKPFAQESARDADAQSLDLAIDSPVVIGHRNACGGRIVLVATRDNPQDRCHVGSVTPKYADLIERRAKGYQTVARNSAVGGLDPDDAAKRGRLAHRAARVRPERHWHNSGRYRCRRTAG